MKKSSIVFSIEMLVSITLFLLNIFVFKLTNIYFLCGYLLLLSIITFFTVGYEKTNFRNKKDIFLHILYILLAYFLITYLFGILFGFTRNGYRLDLISIIKNIFPYLCIIVIREFYRYLYCSKVKESKLFLFLGLVLFVLIDVNLKIHLYDVTKGMDLIKMINLVVFPSISKNIFLAYITTISGYGNAIFYCCVMELNKFVLPIFPDFGDYLQSIINASFPLMILSSLMYKLDFKEQRRIKSSRYFHKNIKFYGIITFFLVVIVVLTSGNFMYYTLTIGSDSMTGTINKGDVAIVKKISRNDLDSLKKKKDIIVYNHDKKIVVHRLVQIKKLNGKRFYITKGDSNLTKDAYFVEESDIVGKVVFRIRYIGLPTVSLSERLNN